MKIEFKLHDIPDALSDKNSLYTFLTWFGSGRITPGSGTFGTIAALPLVIILIHLGFIFQIAVAGVLLIGGIIACEKAAHALKRKDPSYIVIDEVVGFIIATLFCVSSVVEIGFAFLIFRALDILKPPPISNVEKMQNKGLAIMMDDVVAGIATALIMLGLKVVHVF